jgi:hypothetical protein
MLGWRMLSYLLSLSCRVCRVVVDVMGVVVVVVGVVVNVEPVDNKECRV